MAAITFDTQDATRRLRDAGFDERQAETMIRVPADSQSRLVTEEHFDSGMKLFEERVSSEIRLLRWMIGSSLALSAGTAALIFRLIMSLPH